MVKLYIRQSDKKQFQGLFRFFLQNNCEFTIFPEGLKWRNHCASGVIHKEAFANYEFNQRHRLGVLEGTNQKLTGWFSKWRDKGLLTEIPIR